MIEVTGFTNDARQHATLLVSENETCDFLLYFCPTQYSWYFDWAYKDITSKGNKVVLTPNALRQFKNIIPFGIAFYSDDLVAPYKIDDFTTRVAVYTLDADDVQELEDEVFNPNV